MDTILPMAKRARVDDDDLVEHLLNIEAGLSQPGPPPVVAEDLNNNEPPKDKKGRVIRRQYWLFTWQGSEKGMGFDENSNIWKMTVRYLTMHCTHASMQEEKAPTTGRHHIQGFCAFPNKQAKRFPEIKELKHISWCHPTNASEKSNKKYTQKSETAVPGGLWFHKGFNVLKNVLGYQDLYPWQKAIWDMVKVDCKDDRSIHWFCDEEGNAGKSSLVKAMIHHMDAFLFEGKTGDIANRVVAQRVKPKVCLMNLRRSQEEHVNYNAIESLKDGIMATGKYEGGQCIFDSPHVVVFANFMPDRSKLSRDRWKVFKYMKSDKDFHAIEDGEPAENVSGASTW